VRNVDAIVWAVNPANDTLDRFIAYLTHSVEQFLESAGVAARIDAPDRPPPLPLEGSLRHGLFLTVREAVHNAVKHGRPAAVWLTIHVPEDEASLPRLSIVVADDGRGLAAGSPAAASAPPDGEQLATAAESRLGIESMRRRVSEAGGWFTIEPRSHGGTAVTIDVPLEPAVSERFRPDG
jgi:signal transduction histidine kinase